MVEKYFALCPDEDVAIQAKTNGTTRAVAKYGKGSKSLIKVDICDWECTYSTDTFV